MSDAQPGVVRAAGGVVWRRDEEGSIEILLVHRPKYDDWSLPKGKAEPGEDDPDAAIREVREETGLHCDLGPELARVRYQDRHGRPKVVRYWAMTVAPVGGSAVATPFSPNDEVDEAPWVSLADARRRLSYDRDTAVLDVFEQAYADRVL